MSGTLARLLVIGFALSYGCSVLRSLISRQQRGVQTADSAIFAMKKGRTEAAPITSGLALGIRGWGIHAT